jgi:hypothetical protein
MHGGTAFRFENPAFLHDAPQFEAYLEWPIECAMTLVYDLDNTAAIVITVVRLLAAKHLRSVS